MFPSYRNQSLHLQIESTILFIYDGNISRYKVKGTSIGIDHNQYYSMKKCREHILQYTGKKILATIIRKIKTTLLICWSTNSVIVADFTLLMPCVSYGIMISRDAIDFINIVEVAEGSKI